MRPLFVLTATALMSASSLPTAGAAAATRPAPSSAAEALPSVSVVLRKVRIAVGAQNLARLGGGFQITEVADGSGAVADISTYGVRSGEIRKDDFGYDGQAAWQIDGRTGAAGPVSQRQREKLELPSWVRSHWWLNPDSGLAVAVLPAETTAEVVALRVTPNEGLVAATLYIDRASWLPKRLVVPYERGPYTVLYSDYRKVEGVSFPFRTDVSYRGDKTYRTVGLQPLADAAVRFARPALPDDHRFEPSTPARLKTLRGVPFAGGTPGHYYVRPLVDGAPAGWFHFDSGSDGMQIETRIADEHRMPIIGRTRMTGADGLPREATYRRGKTFTLGRLTIKDPVFLALDLSKNNAPPGERRGGVVGYDVFARSVIEFADDGAAITLHDPETYQLPPGAQWRPLTYIDRTPAVRMQIPGGHSGLVQVDTGNAGTVDFSKAFIDRVDLLKGQELKTVTVQGGGGSYSVAVGRMPWVEFGGARFEQPEVVFRLGGLSREGAAGVVGRDFLRRFVTVFDYRNQRIAFIPAAPSQSMTQDGSGKPNQ